MWLEQMEQEEKWEETKMGCGGFWGLQRDSPSEVGAKENSEQR